MKEWLQVLKAADAAARWHVHQRRKGPAEEPYINHLLEVAMLGSGGHSRAFTAQLMGPIVPRYVFTLDKPALPRLAENLADDAAAKRHVCTIADEINRNAKAPSPVLVLPAASPADE